MSRAFLFLLVIVGAGWDISAGADDRGIAARRLLIQERPAVGKTKIAWVSRDRGIRDGGGITRQVDATLTIYYVDDPTNRAELALSRPAAALIRNGKLTRVRSRGLGGIDVSRDPGAGGLVSMLTIRNPADGEPHRMCTLFSRAVGSHIVHAAPAAGRARLLATSGKPTACPTCTDRMRNGDETDVDCGGGTCAKCPPVSSCGAASDCASGVCTGGVCQGPTCADGVRNGDETDVDCGGTCSACAPTKTLLIHNNSAGPIYPVVESPTLDRDDWLQGHFQDSDLSHAYRQTKFHRLYVNPDAGVPAGQDVAIVLPFFSKLVANPDPSLPDQYVDWWNDMRVYLYDDHDALSAVRAADQPSLAAVGRTPSCTTCESMKVHSGVGRLPPAGPYQAVEYTFADVITTIQTPFPIDYGYVTYDVPYVDAAYLPVAVEPVGNSQIGWAGSVMGVAAFRAALEQFAHGQPWPTFVGLSAPRIPGTYDLFVDETSLDPIARGTALTALSDNWMSGTTDPGHPQYSQYKAVEQLFVQNASTVAAECSIALPLSTATLLAHVYGFTPFECSGTSNPLHDTLPPPAFLIAQNSYLDLQYSAAFNPYVQLVHGALGANGYAFSVDDAVGFVHVPGDGIVIAVGGAAGLPNPDAFASGVALELR